MARIFISYRRDDAGYVASMVRERLETEFGAGAVFMDIDNIPLGVDFRQHLSNAVATCDVLVALIGETWAGPLAGNTQRRIDDPQDFVRIEIEAALKRGIPVVPVLIDKAQLPAVHSLPESLRELAFRNAAELRAGRDLNTHLDTLSQGLRAHLRHHPPPTAQTDDATGSPRRQAAAEAADATLGASPAATASNVSTAPTAPPHGPASTVPPPSAEPGIRTPKTAIAAAVALLLVAAVGWWGFGRTTDSGPQTPGPAPGSSPVSTATPATAAPLPRTPGPNQAATTPPRVATGGVAAPIAPAQPEAAVNNSALLDGYKIAIFYLAGDTAAGNTARAIRDAMAARGINSGVELRLATAKKMRDLIPPDGLEVRYDEGREDAQARLLVAILSGRPLRLSPTLRPVPADEPTPNFISVFVPSGG